MTDGRPTWWDWDLELTPHLEKRMLDRDFTEVDLRTMLENASAIEPDIVPGRWVVRTELDQQVREVIVEPDESRDQLVVITAYRPE